MKIGDLIKCVLIHTIDVLHQRYEYMYTLYWIHSIQHTDPFTEGYIGISNQPHKRFRAHTTDTALVGSKLVREYINQNGITSVAHTYLKQGLSLELAKKEEKLYRPKGKIGWNIVQGGGTTPDCSNRVLDQATKDKISEGNKQTRNQRTYISMFKGMTNRHSDEQKKLIGSYHKGKIISDAHKKAITEKLSGSNSPVSKSIELIDTLLNTTHSFDCIKTASIELNINYSALRSALQNNGRLIYKRWKVCYQGTE